MADATLKPTIEPRRRRSSSIKQALEYINNPPQDHHLQHLDTTPRSSAPPSAEAKTRSPLSAHAAYGPAYLQWVQRPSESGLIIGTVLLLYLGYAVLFPLAESNPLAPFIFVQHQLEDGRFRKGWKDLFFLPFWVVMFSFLRQALVIGLVGPLGRRLGIKGTRKLERWQEQGYAIVYFACSSVAGLAMPRAVKTYYLTQFAYWLQQALVMLAGLEKPRSDYVELVVHHIITLWLVSFSYVLNLTSIGIAIFVSMDLPDCLLAFSKCISYLEYEKLGNCSFLIFLSSWSYLRHYQNLRILHSVWYEYGKLVPLESRVWAPAEGKFAPAWMRYQIFIPILALQIVIAFWSYLILRVMKNLFLGQAASDVREEGETGGEESASEATSADRRRKAQSSKKRE